MHSAFCTHDSAEMRSLDERSPPTSVSSDRCRSASQLRLQGTPSASGSTTEERSPVSITAIAKPAKTLLSPHDHALVLSDHQSQMAFDVASIDHQPAQQRR